MFTRQDYLNKKCTHRQYYGQFVTDRMLTAVQRRFGVVPLVKAHKQDDAFNSIPLGYWDQLAGNIVLWGKMPEATGDYWTLAGQVCTLKEAALQLVEQWMAKEQK